MEYNRECIHSQFLFSTSKLAERNTVLDNIAQFNNYNVSVCASAVLSGPYATFLVMSKFCSSCSVLVFLPAGNIASAYIIGVSSLVRLVSALLA